MKWFKSSDSCENQGLLSPSVEEIAKSNSFRLLLVFQATPSTCYSTNAGAGEAYLETGGSLPLVLVEWVDSRQPISQWQWLDQLMRSAVVNCVTVGFLLPDDGGAIVIAQNLGDIGKSTRQVSGVISIPRQAVTRMTPLESPRCASCPVGTGSGGKMVGVTKRDSSSRRSPKLSPTSCDQDRNPYLG